MSTILSFDPAKHRVYWARFVDGELCEVNTTKSGYPNVFASVVVLVEMPRYYPKDPKTRRIDVNDLLDLSVAVGEIKHAYSLKGCRVELVFPRTWKGSVPKEIMSQRIYEAMFEAERVLLPLKRGRPASRSADDHDNNILDACGLGLWKIGRLT